MLGLFMVGTPYFWILLAAAALFIGVAVARDSFGKATFSVIVTFALLGFMGDFNVLHWLRDNALTFAVYVVAYLAAGTVWSFCKWWFFVYRMRDAYLDRKKAFLLGHDLPVDGPIPERLKQTWINGLKQEALYKKGGSHFPPRAAQYKARIMAWMMYWPWSLVVTLVDDPIRRLFNGIFQAIHGLFQRMSDRAFRHVKADFEEAPPAPPAPIAPVRPVTPAGGGNGAGTLLRPEDDLPLDGPSR